MKFVQYYLDCLSQASYLIGDERTGRAVVVDPRRDVDQYCLLYTSPSPRDGLLSRMPSSA